MIKVIIFSDIKIYCEGLSRILSTVQSIEVVCAENTLEDASGKIENLDPDVVLLDMTMRSSSAIAHKVCRLFPDVKVVALAVSENEQEVFEYAQAGIAGYVARDSSIDELIETVICASKGEFRCSPRIAACIFHKVQHSSDAEIEQYSSRSNADGQNPISALTRREQQITCLMAEGFSNKQISTALFIEVSTVKNHVHNILVKLNVHSRSQVVNMMQSHQPEHGSRSLGLVN
jgi:DNA-binding NarL/FixJ family response regulator